MVRKNQNEFSLIGNDRTDIVMDGSTLSDDGTNITHQHNE
jgi:hypothetical protein